MSCCCRLLLLLLLLMLLLLLLLLMLMLMLRLCRGSRQCLLRGLLCRLLRLHPLALLLSATLCRRWQLQPLPALLQEGLWQPVAQRLPVVLQQAPAPPLRAAAAAGRGSRGSSPKPCSWQTLTLRRSWL